MKTFYLLIFYALLGVNSLATAIVYKYMDDSGVAHYANDWSKIPVDKRAEIIEYPEIQTQPGRENPIHPVVNSDVQKRALEEETKKRQDQREKELRQRKIILEKEYEHLLIERSALDNDKSFQKRRTKTRYKHRPYIQEMIKKGQQIDARLIEIEAEQAEILRILQE